MSGSKPTKFDDLDAAELYRSAIEDFAVDVTEADKDKKKVLLAALAESGVAWKDYVAQHPEVAPEPEEDNVVKVGAARPETLAVEPVVAEPVNIRVAESPTIAANDKFLIKMTRENPRFEVRGYKFTQEHPYALVDAKDVEYILSKEDGFRQAFPSELAEFYG